MLLSNLIDRLTEVYREHGDLRTDVEIDYTMQEVSEVTIYNDPDERMRLAITGEDKWYDVL